MASRADNDLILAELLASGRTPRESATLTGQTPETVRRRLRNPQFRALVERARLELAQRVRSDVCRAALHAVATLEALLSDPEPGMRLRAAQALLNTFARLSPVVLTTTATPDPEAGAVIELVQRVITHTEGMSEPTVEAQPSAPE